MIRPLVAFALSFAAVARAFAAPSGEVFGTTGTVLFIGLSLIAIGTALGRDTEARGDEDKPAPAATPLERTAP